MTQPPAQPGPYGPWNAPVQQPPVRARRGTSAGQKVLLGVGTGVMAVALVFASAIFFRQLNAPAPTLPTTIVVSPTSTATYGPGFTIEGTTVKGPTFTATLPQGYQLSKSNGEDNDGGMFNDHDAIAYYTAIAKTADARCTSAIQTLQTQHGGTITEGPRVMWAGTETVSKKLSTTSPNDGVGIFFYLYCVDRPGNKSAAIMALTDAASPTDVTKTVETFLASWTWN